MVWALNHPELFPMEVNRAQRSQLLRIPGIGPRSARKIVTMRTKGKLHSLKELRAAGVWIRRAAPFLLIDGRQNAFQQMDLFPGVESPVIPAGPARPLVLPVGC